MQESSALKAIQLFKVTKNYKIQLKYLANFFKEINKIILFLNVRPETGLKGKFASCLKEKH